MERKIADWRLVRWLRTPGNVAFPISFVAGFAALIHYVVQAKIFGDPTTWPLKVFSGTTNLSLLLSVAGLALASAIYRRQSVQSRSIEQALIEDPTNDGQVVESVIDLLKCAEAEPNSHVLFMAYWVWFGIDTSFPGKLHRVDQLTHDSSEVAQLLKVRLAKNLRTTIVVADDRDFLRGLVRDVLEYRLNKAGFLSRFRAPSITDSDVDSLVDRYLADLNIIEGLVAHSDGTGRRATLRRRSDIPFLVFVKQSNRPHAVYYLGERALVARKADLGGFISRRKHTVTIFERQVEAMLDAAPQEA